MTIYSSKLKKSKIEIDLTGPDGNAFVLLGMAKNLGKKIGMSTEEIEAICNEMRSSDYDNLVLVFDKHFGEYVNIYAGDS